MRKYWSGGILLCVRVKTGRRSSGAIGRFAAGDVLNGVQFLIGVMNSFYRWERRGRNEDIIINPHPTPAVLISSLQIGPNTFRTLLSPSPL